MSDLSPARGRVGWPATFARLLAQSFWRWLDDDAPSKGAALAYYTVFSMAPLLLIVMAVAAALVGEDAARGEIARQLAALIGEAGAQSVEAAVRSTARQGDGALAAVVGTVALLVGATSVFAELENSLNRIWRLPGEAAPQGLWPWMRGRLLSLGMLMAIGFLLVVSLIVTAALAAFARWWGGWFGDWLRLAQALDFLVNFAWLALVFGLIYRWMPRTRLAWRDVAMGAVITALLFTLGKLLIGAYIGRSGMASAYGAAASLVVLLVWVYYSAQIFLFGAEFTWVCAQHRRQCPLASTPPAVAAPAPRATGGVEDGPASGTSPAGKRESGQVVPVTSRSQAMQEYPTADHDVISSERVEGTGVYNEAGDKLGSIDELMIDKRSGRVRYAVMEFGGFLGIGTDRYPLPWDMLKYDTTIEGYVVPLDKARLEKAPRYAVDARPDYDPEYGRSVHNYYGVPYL